MIRVFVMMTDGENSSRGLHSLKCFLQIISCSPLFLSQCKLESIILFILFTSHFLVVEEVEEVEKIDVLIILF